MCVSDWRGLLGGAAEADGTNTPDVPKDSPTKVVRAMAIVIMLTNFVGTFDIGYSSACIELMSC